MNKPEEYGGLGLDFKWDLYQTQSPTLTKEVWTRIAVWHLLSEGNNDEHLEQGSAMVGGTGIHMVMVRETVQEWVLDPVGTDVNTE